MLLVRCFFLVAVRCVCVSCLRLFFCFAVVIVGRLHVCDCLMLFVVFIGWLLIVFCCCFLFVIVACCVMSLPFAFAMLLYDVVVDR